MPTLYDARGNEILAGFPDAVNGSVLINPRTYTSVLSAVNAGASSLSGRTFPDHMTRYDPGCSTPNMNALCVHFVYY